MDAGVLAIGILGATVAGVVGYGMRRDARSRRRLAAGQCVRCGVETSAPIDLTASELHPKVALLMCAQCAKRTRRNHRIAYWTYLALCGVVVGAMSFGTIRDLRRGVHYSMRDYWWLTSVVLLPAFGLLPMFRQGLDHD